MTASSGPFRLAVALFIVAAAARPAAADPAPGTRVGIAAGDPSGFSLAVDIGAAAAVRASVGWDLLSPGGPVAALDALLRGRPIAPLGIEAVPYFGIGAKATFIAGDGRFGDSSATHGLGIRAPLGLSIPFHPWPIECAVEFAPGFRMFPGIAFDPDAAIGVRIHL